MPSVNLSSADLGPLAWVLGEIQKAVEGAVKTLRRQARQAREGNADPAGIGPVRVARQQLHQAVGALHMVGCPAPALVLGAMEFAVQGFTGVPGRCDEAAVDKVERAGFATLEYLRALLAGKRVSSVALFSQYREVLELTEATAHGRIHPADLWSQPWRWLEVRVGDTLPALAHGPAVRSQLDRDVLKLLVSGDRLAAQRLHALCLGLAHGAHSMRKRNESIVWTLAAAFFEALALALIPQDVYAKRATSRVLLQYASLARGDTAVSDTLGRDLLFLCAQALPAAGDAAATLRAVRAAWGLANHPPVDYTSAQFGRFAPLLLTQARQRIEAAKDLWSALAGGDVSRLRQTVETFALLGESLQKLYPASLPMAQALTLAVDASLRSAQAPGTALAMEVATAVLYLEAAFEDLDPHDAQLPARTLQLAARIDRARNEGQLELLEDWMEDLYRRVNDRRTMGTVVDELRSHLGELEKSLDQYFRRPSEKNLLRTVPAQLQQMRGVFSVLGLDQAAHAVLRMRADVDRLLDAPDVPASGAGATDSVGADLAEAAEVPNQAMRQVDSLGNNLGALGFLVDMLAYQPALAKRLFVFDPEAGELKPLMGRHGGHGGENDTDQAGDALDTAALEADPRSGPGVLTKPTLLFAEPVALSGAAADAELTARLTALAYPEEPIASMEEFSRATESWTSRIAGSTLSETAPGTEVTELGEVDINDIFLVEAREALLGAMTALAALADDVTDNAQQIVLRRGFHTLKGSSRMIGLDEFGNAAWSLEQLLNVWLADRRPVTPQLLRVLGQSVQDLGQWVQAIASGVPHDWCAESIAQAADALCQGKPLPEAAYQVAQAPEQPPAPPAALPMPVLPDLQKPDDLLAALDHDLALTSFEAPFLPPSAAPASAASVVVPSALVASNFFDFGAPNEVDLPVVGGAVWSGADAIDFLALADPMESLPVEPIESVMPALQALPVEFRDGPALVEHLPAPAVATEFIWLQPSAEFSLAAQLDDAAAAADVDIGLVDAGDAGDADDIKASAPVDTSARLSIYPPDDAVQAAGPLRIGAALYDVYLNEADEWSCRLISDLNDWAQQPSSTRLPDSSIALAHSLAGSSATVGFNGLSELACLLELALQNLHRQGCPTADDGMVLMAAADELRGLLHQFSAGFLRDPDPALLEVLSQLAVSPMPPSQAGAATELVQPEPDAPVADVPVADVPTADAPTVPVPLVDLTGVLPVPGYAPASSPRVYQVVADDETDETDETEAIDLLDAVDAELFPIFEEEAIELLPQLGAALRAWADRPGSGAARAATLRTLHTLKGSARLAGAMRLGERAHAMESEIALIGTQRATQAAVDGLLARFDVLQVTFDRLCSDDAAREAVQAGQAATLSSDLEASAASVAPATPAGLGGPSAAGVTGAVPMPAPSLLVPPRNASNQVVRIRTQILDRLVTQAGEVIITRSRIEVSLGVLRSSLNDLTGNLERLRQQLRDLELQAESQMQSRLAQAKDSQQEFDPLESDRFTRVQELTRMMAESVDDVGTVQRTLQRTVQATEDDLTAQARQTRELQRALLRTRMVEFEGLSERLYRVVRQATKDTGKPVRLDITGGSIEIDRGVLDRMAPAFEHLLRNSVAHGIEDAATRARAGKNASGLIVIALHQEGNDVSVSFTDDGAGLDYQRIAERAQVLGLTTPGQALSHDEAAEMIIQPGFSTADQVSELAGRGIGMDVVRTNVAALGGRIETSSTPGQGTTFKLVLPLTTAVTHVVMLRAGKTTVGVPSTLVELVLRVSSDDLAAAYAHQRYTFAGEELPFFWADALLQASPGSDRPASARANTVVVVRSASQRIAMHVDEVLGNQEVVVKNLGPQLARLPGMAGITVLASGAVALIYNPVALAAVHGEAARRLQGLGLATAAGPGDAGEGVAPAWRQVAPQTPLILVVDDSITVRRVTQRLLLREGYRVLLAVDGLQALERLQQERPAVVLSDIEMPRMDGFDLARNIRADATLAGLPIIMITSRIAEKHREHALALGVDHYLGKPYAEGELLGLVRHYTSAEVPR